jgi:hypothetical protein
MLNAPYGPESPIATIPGNSTSVPATPPLYVALLALMLAISAGAYLLARRARFGGAA